jgi:hypothetical protein
MTTKMATKIVTRSAAVLVLFCGFAWGEELAMLNFVIFKDYNGKPIRNASVIMHSVKGNGQQRNTGLELKTDAEGKASFDGIPFGKLRVQVIATGYQTYGDDYTIDKTQIEIVVKMKRPGEQYSIYKDHPDHPDQKQPDTKDDKHPDSKPEEPKKD